MIYFYWGVGAALVIALIEILLRDNLQNFFQENSVNVKKIPKLVLERQYEFLDPTQDRMNWSHDKVLGWKLNPSSELAINIHIPGMGLDHRFTYRTDSSGRRITSVTPESSSNDSRPVISVLGCSFTYGHSLNDNETYSWLLQDKFPSNKVYNYAVAGYSLYQSLLVLEKTIKVDKPKAVVVGFHPDLGRRNTNSFNWVHLIQSTWRIPSCVAKNETLHRYPANGYKSLPFSSLRLVKVIEFYLNRIIYSWRGKDTVIRKTMERLLIEMRSLCEQQGTKFIVACIDDSSAYYEFLGKNGFDWCVTGVDTKELKDDGTYKWILHPFDNHPNQEANRKYADVIAQAIEDVLANKKCTPDPRYLRSSIEKRDHGSFIYPHF
jgi:hypothetical protein